MHGMACLYTLFDSVEMAEATARTLLAERQVACANIHAQCRSLYRWESAVMEAYEIPVLFKMPRDAVAAAVARLTELHPYDTPAIVVWEAETTPDYARWLTSEVGV